MTKNIAVFDSEGKIIGETYAKRAAGLVKKGRARYVDGACSAIVLARSPGIDYTSEEDETMSTFSTEDLNKKIEEMLHEAKEKLDGIRKSAADAIEEFTEKMESSENVKVEVNGDGEKVLVVDGEDEESTEADEAEETADTEEVCDGDEAEADAECEETPDTAERGRFIRISDEDMEKLKEKMRSFRAALGNFTDEAKVVIVKTGNEIGKYAEGVRTKVAEKMAEREAESKAAAEAKSEAERIGSEAYYLSRIDEIRKDMSHLEAMERLVRSADFEDENISGAAAAIAEAAAAHEINNRKLLDFYISRLDAMHGSQNG